MSVSSCVWSNDVSFVTSLHQMLIVSRWTVYIGVVVSVRLRSCSREVKFVQECGVARLWEVARFDFLLPRN